MRLIVLQDVAAPIEVVWDRTVDVDRLEAGARERDSGLRRVPEGPPGPGTRWEMTVPIQGRRRLIEMELVALDAPVSARMRARVEGIEIGSDFALAALAPDRTRMRIEVEARAAGLAGRLLLGALALARPQIERGLAARLLAAARRIEDGPPG